MKYFNLIILISVLLLIIIIYKFNYFTDSDNDDIFDKNDESDLIYPYEYRRDKGT